MSSIPYIREGSSNVRMPKDYGYVYTQVSNWASLDDLVDPKEGDVVKIGNLGPGGGIVLYGHRGEVIYTSGGWKLTKAEAFSKVKLDEYITGDEFLAVDGCIGIVCGNAAPTAESEYYYWNGTEWLRTPDGVGYIYPSVTDMSEMSAIASPINGDKVFVEDTGYATGGYMVYTVGETSTWKLEQGYFLTVDDMEAFSAAPDTVQDYAIVSVGSQGPAYPHYVFNEGTSEWIRTPDGAHYTWPQVNNWSELLAPTSARPYALNNDRVPVNLLETPYSKGIAIKHGSEWQLLEGNWISVSDMENWENEAAGRVIHNGGGLSVRGFVDPSHAFDANATAYFYDGSSWVRMADEKPITFTLTSLQDFSGVGLKDGDYGILTPTDGAPITVRYKAACPIALGAGNGTTPMWLPPVVYAGTPEIKAYLIGTETQAGLAPKGWATSTIGTGTITTVGGYVRLLGPTGALSQAAITAPAITTVNKFYLVGDFRGTAGGTDPYIGIFATSGNPVQYALGRGTSSGILRQFILSGGAWVASDTVSQIARGGRNLPATVPFVIQALSSSEITELVESRIDGELYSSYRRNFNGAVLTPTPSSYSMQILANGGGGGTTSTLELRNLYYITY